MRKRKSAKPSKPRKSASMPRKSAGGSGRKRKPSGRSKGKRGSAIGRSVGTSTGGGAPVQSQKEAVFQSGRDGFVPSGLPRAV